MGLLRVHIDGVRQLGPSWSDYIKAKSRFCVRLSVCNADAYQCQDTNEVERAGGGLSHSTEKFALTNPSSFNKEALELRGVRFSAPVAVELFHDKRHRPICRAFLSLQHCVMGVERSVTLQLYPMAEDVSDELPAVGPMASVRLRLTPVDFCPDASTVDHVVRTEQDTRNIKRLQLFYAAYAPQRLPFLDVEAAAARDGLGGWDLSFHQLLKDNNFVEPELRTLRVTIKQGLGMPRERTSYVDPYVQLSVVGIRGGNEIGGLGEVHQTNIQRDLLNPEFNETFEVSTFRAGQDSIRFRLWDYDPASPDDVIGEAVIPLGLLVRDTPTTRTLPVFNGSHQACQLVVVLHAMDFGLDPASFGALVEAVVEQDRPRLERYYQRYNPSRLKMVEQELINHALTPGAFEAHMEALVKIHGREPGKDTVVVSIEALQNVLLPQRRTKVDLTKNCADGVENLPDHHTHQSFQIRVNGMCVVFPSRTPAELFTNAAPTRVAFRPQAASRTVHISKPENDRVKIELFVNRQHGNAREKPKCDVLVGAVELSVNGLVQGQQRTRSYALVSAEHDGTTSPQRKFWFNGSVVVSLYSEHIGKPVATSCLDDDEVESVYRQRLGGILRRYENSRLPHLHAILEEQAMDPQGYMDTLVRKHGPEPGTYRVQLTIERCEDLPRVELTGAGIDCYVRVETREECHATAVVASRSPRFQETFELDICDPTKESIQCTVMDFDRNSADDPIAVYSIPIKSLSRVAETRVLPLVAHPNRHSLVKHNGVPMEHGSLVVTMRSIGFGPQAPFFANDAHVCDTYRQRLYGLLLRYDALSAARVEELLWQSVEENSSEASLERAMESTICDFVKSHGCERGNGVVQVTVHYIEELLRDKPEENFRGGDERFLKGKTPLSGACKPYVSVDVLVSDPVTGSRGLSEDCNDKKNRWMKTSEIPAVSVPLATHRFNIEFATEVDLERPPSDPIYLTVHDGSTIFSKLGVAVISAAALLRNQPGSSMHPTRLIRVPIVSNDDFVCGWATISLSSSVAGIVLPPGEREGCVAALEDTTRRNDAAVRLVRYFDRYAPHKLSTVDRIVSEAEAQWWVSNATAAPPTAAAYDEMMRRVVADCEGYAEPGTFRLSLQVRECTNLPRIEILSAGDPYIQVTVEGEGGGPALRAVRSSVSKPTTNPKFPLPLETLTVDFLRCPSFDTTRLVITVMDYDANSKDDEWCRVVVPVKSLWSQGDISTRTIPLVPVEEGLLPRYIKTLSAVTPHGFRQSTYAPPTITFSAHCVGFGVPPTALESSIDRLSAVLDMLRMDVYRLLHRYSPSSAPTYECHVWSGVSLTNVSAISSFDSVDHVTRTMGSLEHTYGRREGGGLVSITIDSIEKLMKGRKPAKSAKPYVEFHPKKGALTIPITTEPTSTAVPHTKSQKSTPGPNHTNINETFTFDLPNPDDPNDTIELRVMDDVVGADYEFGRVIVCFGNGLLQSGGVPRKRTFSIVHKAGMADAAVVGSISVTIVAQTQLHQSTPIDEETQGPLLKRVFAMYKRYLRARMHECEILAGVDRLQHLEQLVLRHGPEPGTFRVVLTVHGCEQLPKIETIGGCDPYVEVEHHGEVVQTRVMKSNLNPTFDETFEIDIVDPLSGVINIIVYDYDAGSEDDPVARLNIPVASIVGEMVRRVYPLPLVTEVFSVLKKRTGSITLSMRAIGFGLSELVSPLATECDARNRIAAVYDFYSRPLPADYERELWAAVSFEDALRKVVAKCGPEPGSRLLTITIDSMEGLMDGNQKLVADATPYVKVVAPSALGGQLELETKPSLVRGPQQSNYNQTLTVELADPSSDVITFTVMNDVVGKDYEFGKARLSASLLQRNVPKQRRVPIIKLKEGSAAQTRGFITVTLHSTRFGLAEHWDEEAERTLTDRLHKLYMRHRPGLVGDVDSRVASHWRRWEKYLADEIQQHGPEPGTFTLQLRLSPLPDTALTNTFHVQGESSATVATREPQTASSVAAAGQAITFHVDLMSPTELLTIVERDKHGRVLRQARFPLGWVCANGQPQQRMVTVVPNIEASSKALVLSDLKMMEVTVTTSTCKVAGAGKVVPTTSCVEVEDAYRRRIHKLVLRSDPQSLLRVDSLVLGVPEAKMERHLAECIATCGAESGQTTVSVAIRAIDELPSDVTTSVYAKVYLCGKPICKRLLAEALNSPKTAPPVFSTPVDCLRVHEDLLQLKLGTMGIVSSKVLGRSCYPVRFTPLGKRVDGSVVCNPPLLDADNVYEIRCWIFDEERRVFAGRVTLWVRLCGFPPISPSDSVTTQDPRTWGRRHGPSLVEGIVFKELIAAGWRSRPTDTPSGLTDFVTRALASSSTTTPSGGASPVLSDVTRALVRDTLSTSRRRSAMPDTSLQYLHVVGCRGLPRMDRFGTSDTFVDLVVISRGPSSGFDAVPNQRTTVHSGTLNPTFRFHREDVFVLEYTNQKQLGLLPLASVVPAQDTSVPPVITAVQQLQHQQQVPQNNRPVVQLHVKDRDPGSEELIGIVDVSVEMLAAGFYHVDPCELLALTSAKAAEEGQRTVDEWLAQNSSRLLKLPIVLPDGGADGVRGEIILATSTECLSQTSTVAPYLRHALAATDTLNATVASASSIFASHKCWTELQSLHSYVYRQLFCDAKMQQKFGAVGGSLEERCGLLMQSLMVEYGAAK